MGTIYRNGQYYGGSSGGATAELDRHEIGYGNDESNIVGSGLFTKKNANIVEDLCEEQQSNSLEFIIDSTTDGDMPAGTITISNGTLETNYDSTQYVKNYEGHGYIGPINYLVSKDKNYTIKFIFETFNKDLADKDYYLSFIGYEDYANINLHKSITSVQEAGATVYYVTCTVNTNEAFTDYIVFPPTIGQDLAIYNGNADQNGGKFFLKNKGILCISGNNLTTLDGNTKFTMHDNAEMDLTGESIILMDDEGIIFGNATGTASFTIEELNSLKNSSGGGTGGDNPPYELPIASETELGGVKIGEGINMAEDGTISVEIPESSEPYELPAATNTTLGGVKIGKGLSINDNGVLSANDIKYDSNTLAINENNELTVISESGENYKAGTAIEFIDKIGKELDCWNNGIGWSNLTYENATSTAILTYSSTYHSPISQDLLFKVPDDKKGTIIIKSTDNREPEIYFDLYNSSKVKYNSIGPKYNEDEVIFPSDAEYFSVSVAFKPFSSRKSINASNISKVTFIFGEFNQSSINVKYGDGLTLDEEGKLKVDFPDSYELPTASSETLGGIKVSESAGLQVNESGELDLKIKIVPCTQEQYDALEVKDPNTLYLIGD